MRLLHRVVRRLVPYPFHVFLLRPKPDLVAQAQLRRDVVRLELGPQACLELYWKETDLGKGPALILAVAGCDVLRFDCFGAPGGHFHLQVMRWRRLGQKRLRLPELTRETQIERALFELQNNFQWYLDHHPLRRVRRTQIDPERMTEATDEARNILLSYAKKCA